MQNTIRKFGQLIAGSLIGAGLAVPSLADDIDVFYSTLNNPGDAETMVMFSLDWRPNFFSTICNGACPEFHAAFGNNVNGEPYLKCSDGTCNTIKRYDAFRAALKLVVDEVTTGGNTGLKLGLMMNHSDNRTCNGNQGPGNAPNKKCSNGGHILLGFVDADDPFERQKFSDKLDALPASPQGGASHFYQGAELNFEFFRYLTGQGVYNGYNGWKDFGTDDTYNIDDQVNNDAVNVGIEVSPWGAMGWDAAAITSDVYNSPLAQAGECSSIYALHFLHQVSQQDSDSDNDIKATKANGGMYGIGNNPDFDATLAYLHDVDLADGSFNSNVDLEGNVNVTSYFIVDPSKINTKTNGYAEAGGSGEALAFQDDPAELVELLRNIIQEILAESTTFVSTAVAANTLNRAQTREDLYIALFEANEDNEPFWDGNTKKIKIKTIQVPVVDEFGNPVLDGDGNPVTEDKQALVDANNTDAVNPLDGRLKASALTFWTDDTSLSPPPPDETDYTDSTDGREVARGGAGQRIPGFLPSVDPGFSSDTGRNVLTEPASYTNGTPVSLIDLDADSATAIDLLTNDNALYETVMNCTSCTYSSEPDTSKQTEAVNKVVNMLKFSRGYDVPFDDADHSSPDGRDWWVGAPLHSRPLILNFGNRGSYTGTQPDIRILTAGDAGVLHMVKDSNPDGTSNGTESWAFLPREFIPAQKRFMENVKGLHNPGIPAPSPVLPAHPYLLDSSAVALYIDNDLDGTIETGDSDKVYVYICMRRGGKGCYALDLSNPDDPKLMWTIDKADAEFGEMAQSWSLLRAGLVAYTDSGGDLVQTAGLFFGAGYNGDDGGDRYGDLGKDSRTGSVGTDDFEGNGVFVVDARDGSLIWKAVGPENAGDTGNGWSSSTNTLEVPDMKDSIPGDIFLFDSDGDGITDRIYFADTGGILWRGDIVPGSREYWTMTRMLNFGRHYSATNADDRRAFSRVDVAKARELVEPGQLPVGDPFDAVVVTTGDRAHPTGTDVEDWVYMFKDKNIASGAPPSDTLPSDILAHDQLQDLTDNCLQDGNNSDCPDLDGNGELPKLDNGWKVRLNHCGDAAISVGTDCGEKGLSRPLIINNTVFFTTYLPPAASGGLCELAQGKGLFYAMKLQNATAVFDFNLSNNTNDVVLDRFDELASPGIPPAPVALSSGTILRPDLVVEEVPPPSNGPTFWYETYLK